MSDINITTSEAQPLYFTIQGIFQAGLDGADGKTVLNGSGVPSDGVGSDGDFYIDTDTYEIYLKGAGTWGSPTSLIGADGNPGLDGNDGADGTDGKSVLNGSGSPASGLGTDGDFYIDTSTYEIYLKTAGVWGSPVSLVGADGADGQGVVAGGTTGQVLAKASNADFDTEWVDQSGGGGTESRLYITETFNYANMPSYTGALSGVYSNSTVSDTISGGSLTQQTQANATAYSQLRLRPIGINTGYNIFDLSPCLSITMSLNNNGNTTSQSGALITTDFDKYSAQLSTNKKYAGFINKAGTIYAVSNDGTGEEATDISATWPNNSEHIGHIACTATDVKFYVDGTLIATHTTKVPTGADNSSYQMTIISDNNGTATLIQNKFYSYTFSIKVA